jgi:hypothetical protein
MKKLVPFSTSSSSSYPTKKGSNVLFPGALPLASAGVGALEHIFTIFHLYNTHNFCTSSYPGKKILRQTSGNSWRWRGKSIPPSLVPPLSKPQRDSAREICSTVAPLRAQVEKGGISLVQDWVDWVDFASKNHWNKTSNLGARTKRCRMALAA